MLRKTLLVLAASILGFAYGVASARYGLFPYGILESAHEQVRGWLGSEPPRKRQSPQPGFGLWHKFRHGGRVGDVVPQDLANLPYLGGYDPATEAASVTVHDPAAAYDGLNLVVSGDAPHATLEDMTGRVLHEWRRRFEEIWPGLEGFDDREGHKTFWRRAHVFPDGDLLAIFDGIGMVKLDRDSNVLWGNAGRYHHDLFLDDQDRIWTLSRHWRHEHPRFRMNGPIEEDFVSVLTPDGEEVRRISVLAAFLDSDYRSLLSLARKRGDILHTNTIELMDGRFADRHPLFAEGNALLSIPTLNTVAVLDVEKEQIVWALAGLWTFQHQPTVLDNGNLLVFDNTGEHGGSKVVEIDPLTQEIDWAFRHSEDYPFGSFILGSCQRLPNGNTLITESTTGRAFEVTRGGDVVWEYINPNRSGDDGELIASLLEVVRIEHGYFDPDFLTVGNGRDDTRGSVERDGEAR